MALLEKKISTRDRVGLRKTRSPTGRDGDVAALGGDRIFGNMVRAAVTMMMVCSGMANELSQSVVCATGPACLKSAMKSSDDVRARSDDVEDAVYGKVWTEAEVVYRSRPSTRK